MFLKTSDDSLHPSLLSVPALKYTYSKRVFLVSFGYFKPLSSHSYDRREEEFISGVFLVHVFYVVGVCFLCLLFPNCA